MPLSSIEESAQAARNRWADVAHGACFVAHRGGAELWPENSLLAFRNSLAAGYGVFELDVHGTLDRDLVVMHDLTVDRTSDGAGAIRDLSTADLGRIRLRGTNGEGVPYLDDVLQLFRSHGAASIVEVKFSSDTPEHDDLCRSLIDALERSGMLAATTVSAFDWKSLAKLRRLSSTINLTAVASARGLAERGGLASTIAGATDLGAQDLALEWTAVGPSTAAKVRDMALRLGVWTPNEPSQHARMISYGVDWIITDRPDLASTADLKPTSPSHNGSAHPACPMSDLKELSSATVRCSPQR
ncbi:MAG: hypothetical protein KJZ80_05565 [Hyphomicrobiaceae bacterium]|nr:hypothetical protein [Hyphomicrobiaceae bacterium]